MPHVARRNTFLLLAGDVAIFIGALVLTLVLRYGEWPSRDLIVQHLSPFLALSFLWTGVFFIGGLYDTYISLVRKNIPSLVLRVQVVNILLAALVFFLFPIGIAPKTILVLYLVVSTTLIIFWRLFIFPRISVSRALRSVVVGSGLEAKELVSALNHNPQFRFIDAELINTEEYDDVETLRERLAEQVTLRRVNLIVGDMHDQHARVLAPLYYSLTLLAERVRFMSLHDLYEQMFRRVPPSLIGDRWFLENATTQTPHYAYDFLKRMVDIMGALVLLIPCLIIFPVVYLAIKLGDGGSAIYRSERIGQFNRPMVVYKFRTMNGMDSGATLDTTLVVTPLGRILRKTRLDELPQLWNVFRGDLSFVGPRPEFPARAHVYAENIPYYNMRHRIKPGLSGWAQISNFEVPRGDVDIERTIAKLSFDLFYLKRRSFLFDIEIILKTIQTLLARSGT